mgnify:CR=1 FL=1
MPTRVTTSLQVSSTQQRASQLKAAARAHAATLEQEAEDERRRGGASIALRDEQGMIVPEPPAVESRKVMVSLYGPDGELQLVTKEEAASRAAHELAQAAASAEHARLMARRAGAARGRGAVAAARRLLLEGLLAGYERCIAALSRSTSQGEGAGPRAARMSVWRELGSMMVQEGKDGSVRRARCVGTVVWLLQQDKLPQRDSARAQLAWLIDNFVDPVRAFDRTTRCERSLASSEPQPQPHLALRSMRTLPPPHIPSLLTRCRHHAALRRPARWTREMRGSPSRCCAASSGRRRSTGGATMAPRSAAPPPRRTDGCGSFTRARPATGGARTTRGGSSSCTRPKMRTGARARARRACRRCR